ncbi:cysteine-rich domain protein [delta proteobacterium NaphS2]|nr:cysteine-rich domain protein [delta proteobacterium NaphS2]
MTNPKIILFLCNWGPHSAFQILQDEAAEIPLEIKMVRIPCTGRISKALLFKCFEMGAEGVALVGCSPGTCRYGTGTTNASGHVEDTRSILELLGLGKERLRLATFLPDESEALLEFLQTFRDEIGEMGPSPVVPTQAQKPGTDPREALQRLAALHDVFACQDCGKCSSACPLTLVGKPFSPRATANAAIGGQISSPSVQNDIWSCLTCGLCSERCPSAVDFSRFVRDLRDVVVENRVDTHAVHGGFFHSLMRTMTSEDLQIRQWEWLPDDVTIDNKSKILFFGGCAPYFDLFFRRHIGLKTRDILVDSIRLLNFFDIHPSILQDLRCCGHDLLWSGDKPNFLKLAKLNARVIEDAGIEEVVTACPECYRTLLRDYPEHGVDLNFKVTHLYDFLENEIDKGAVGFKQLNRRLTFQDPCRLSRFENRPDLPRKLIGRLNPMDFKEMRDHGANAICCGNSAWIGCDSFSKALQVKRIGQAKDTKSDLLVTGCPKCQIHLRCAMEDPFKGESLKMEMMDLTSVLAKTIQWE